MLRIKPFILLAVCLLSFELALFSQGQLTVLPLGNSITRGSMCLNGDIYSCDRLQDQDAIGYRHRLYTLLNESGYNPDFIGNFQFGTSIMTDADNAGFSGIRDSYLADVMESGTSSYTGQVTSGPYLNSYPAEIILLHIGTNDVLATDYSVGDVARILDAIDDYESSSGKPILVFLAEIISKRNKPCNTDAGIVSFNGSLVSMAQTRINSGDHIVLVDMECGAGLDYYSDLIDQAHPNQTGYDKMADKWYSTITNYNNTPQLTQIPDQSVDRGSTFSQISLDSYIDDVEDSDQDILWSISPSSPEYFNVSIDQDRVVTISPKDPDWSGSETIEFVATDNGRVISALRKSASCLTQLTVNWIPEILGQQPLSTPEATPLVILLNDLIIVEPDKAPAGLQLVINNGDHYSVQGQTITPENNYFGTIMVPVKLVDDGNESNLYTLSVQVTEVNHPPEIISTPVLTAKAKMEYVYQLVVDDEDPDDVHVFSADEKPAWLQVNASTGLVSGIPSTSDVGTTSIKLRVSDGSSSDTQSYSLEVKDYNLPPEITTEPRDTALIAQTYSYGIQATDAEGDPLTYFANTIPDWLDFHTDTHVLIGVPNQQHSGENLVVLGVTDQKDTTYQPFVINVISTSHITYSVWGESTLVYPNPASERLLIDLKDFPMQSSYVLFELMDMTGRKVVSKNLINSYTEIGLLGEGLHDGIYVYRLTDPIRKVLIKSGKLRFELVGN